MEKQGCKEQCGQKNLEFSRELNVIKKESQNKPTCSKCAK